MINSQKVLNSKLINKAALAREMYPDSPYPVVLLYKKMKGQQRGYNFTAKDKQKLQSVIEQFIKEIQQ